MTYVGTLVHGLAWTDGQGEQVAIFSREMEEEEGEFFSSSVTLHVYHYRLTPAGVSLVREVKDFTLDCEFDNMAAFVPEAMGLTDLDQDGEAELTFAYYLGCTSDVSPLPFKLLLLESGSKYIIRGDVVPPMMGESSQVPDPAFAAGPAIFLEHAQQLWNKTARYPGL
ncbi:MAG: hypothetical protein D6722_06990 [Bacteroidetes bacterium]|nr:MAG: hypothetical protein D6722_06990 [Bacteroidota bacterium]